ncbi:MAG: sugar transferase [Candidatus Marinimicrobia bacterium]|nr:sugar transferase [Candidatus Neomarinimicrobiota bacterium]
MNLRKNATILLVLIDFIATFTAMFLFYIFKFKTGIVTNPIPLFISDIPLPALMVSLGWMLFFWFSGLYSIKSPTSRFDEALSVIKTVSVGSLLLMLLTLQIENIITPGKILVITYWLGMIVFVAGGRLIYRTVQRNRFMEGKELYPSILVGWNERSKALNRRIQSFPGLGYSVVGFVSTRAEDIGETDHGSKVIGEITELPKIIKEYDIKEVILALSSNDHKRLLDVIKYVNGEAVGIKISPDMYDIISGQARTNQIYGLPLIEILPEFMPAWERSVKRLMDILVSIGILGGLLPFWLLFGIIIKIDSRGKILYRQERVGKEGRQFNIFKFRSMSSDAESETGPVWATEDDPRVTRVGKFLRATRIDEVPQFINVLMGDMSLVGPRPERQFFVDQLKKEMPLYTRRLRIRPGITGWAQIKHKYDESLDDVKRKLRYDLFYIENMSLRMDFKIILSTIKVILSGKGHFRLP